MAASLHFFSSILQTPGLHRSCSGAGSASSFYLTTSCRHLAKHVPPLSAIKNYGSRPASGFVRNVAYSSELEEGEEEQTLDFSDAGERSFAPDVKLFVGNLPFNVDSSALAELFQKAGNVEMVEVIYDKLSGRSRGFGFVTMSSIEEAEAAVQQFNGYELQGREIRVNSGPPPPKRDSSSFRDNSSFRGGPGGRERSSGDNSNRLYVGNLAWGVDDLALETLFSEQGTVKEARVVYDRETGRSRGFGFVTYSSPEEVNSAIEALDGVDLDGRSIRVSPAEARQRQF